MPGSHDVQFWKLAKLKRTAKRKRVFGVRWVVAGHSFSKWFEFEAQADNYRSQLMQAARRGEAFDTATGQPESVMRQQQTVTWFELACGYVDLKWQPRSRGYGATRFLSSGLTSPINGRCSPAVLWMRSL